MACNVYGRRGSGDCSTCRCIVTGDCSSNDMLWSGPCRLGTSDGAKLNASELTPWLGASPGAITPILFPGAAVPVASPNPAVLSLWIAVQPCSRAAVLSWDCSRAAVQPFFPGIAVQPCSRSLWELQGSAAVQPFLGAVQPCNLVQCSLTHCS